MKSFLISSALRLKCLLWYIHIYSFFPSLEYYSSFKRSQECHDSVDLIIPNMVETLKITNAGITENDFLTNNITIPDVDQEAFNMPLCFTGNCKVPQCVVYFPLMPEHCVHKMFHDKCQNVRTTRERNKCSLYLVALCILFFSCDVLCGLYLWGLVLFWFIFLCELSTH